MAETVHTRDLEDDQIAQAACDIANKIEAIAKGQPTAAVLYALGMVIASGVAKTKIRDVDATMTLITRAVRVELARQFSEGEDRDA